MLDPGSSAPLLVASHLCKVPDDEASVLSLILGATPSLRSVPLYRCLAHLPKLAALDLSHSENVTDGILHTIANISGLTWLALNGCSDITGDGALN